MSVAFPIADAHCDFLYGMYQHDYDIRRVTGKQTVSIPHMQKGGVKLQFFAVWLDRALKIPYAEQCLIMIDKYHQMLEDNSGVLTPLTADFSPNNSKIATVLTVEGGEGIDDTLSMLRVFKRLGVSALSLTWNHNNKLANAAVKRGSKGLTAFGKEAILEMERIGIALDVSHLNDAGIDDALSILKTPIFASHSNSRAICNSPRCLRDEHIKEIAGRGGVVGVNFYYKQLTRRDEACIDDIVRHIVHVVEVGGIEGCAIGSDFDGMTQYPLDMPNPSFFQRLVQALQDIGFSEDDVFRISYGNLLSYIIQFV